MSKSKSSSKSSSSSSRSGRTSGGNPFDSGNRSSSKAPSQSSRPQQNPSRSSSASRQAEANRQAQASRATADRQSAAQRQAEANRQAQASRIAASSGSDRSSSSKKSQQPSVSRSTIANDARSSSRGVPAGSRAPVGGIAAIAPGPRNPLASVGSQSQLAPSSSPRPVMRGTPVEAPTFVQRFGDFLQGRRPFVGLGGVFNSEGSFADEGGSDRSPFMNISNDSDNTPPAVPTKPVEEPAADGRPPWWPPYLPWPPEPGSPYAPMVAPQAGPAAPAAPVVPTQYYNSYSGLQNAISGAQNPLMMGIGGIVRRP